jgi:hypothetical protein
LMTRAMSNQPTASAQAAAPLMPPASDGTPTDPGTSEVPSYGCSAPTVGQILPFPHTKIILISN